MQKKLDDISTQAENKYKKYKKDHPGLLEQKPEETKPKPNEQNQNKIIPVVSVAKTKGPLTMINENNGQKSIANGPLKTIHMQTDNVEKAEEKEKPK